ncbi:DUF6232 family protein [Streptomyces sp. NBC_01803]|uniref:DUF6232 family protein n=1 Tax=Streptomyces sp. NBC_01803 TaxID=2975946 RepID=UPI002DDA349B|nr:DUF6232 family protein [Streptomyces sp. NBC_01803]WSA45174.1 DUF6232 family protein [Streptomyces sp. NBC_01803]
MTSADSAGQAWKTPSDAISAAESPPPPAAPPPPPVAPPQPPAGPPPTADPYPDVASAASTQPIIGVDLRVSKRLLWIGDAYYPLHNLARVYTLTIRPRRKDAVLLFLKRLLIIGAVTTFLSLLAAVIDESGGSFGSSDSNGSGGLSALVVIIAVAALIYSLVVMLQVLGAPAHFVLAVETSGPSTAVVTSQRPDQLRQLARQIADAIENPEADFAVRVNTITISPKHYYFGDSVNMYGGTGNVGMAS